MKKIFSICVAIIVLGFAMPASAAREVPVTQPLQPIPENNFANLSGNVQSGDAVKEKDQATKLDDEAMQPDDYNAANNPDFNLPKAEDVKIVTPTSGLTTLLAFATVFFSAAITVLYYWFRKRRKQNKVS